ncbi:uncharacterized protein B0P05DRAFT_478333 [Gilbertella persicaria]|uniref:uncharacterized protein n=1 Tax=Gilbertella persicaria TaxID=101096 RepID=UPI00221ECCF1|nr:uncharacterized protein B0P05DRAFT_478333 [Gilbertella persicaria]KAI8059027.1 hypothetical protein B0P05DRAFT_478333 [Gilbertella persicaria]
MNHPQEELDDKNSSQVRLPKPSSLLLKRLAPKHGHKKNLTIMTPSYNEETVHGIQSAPLKRSALPPFQTRTIRFPSPPIVPSQQPAYMTQKQKFLQPFEFLYDHIEQTRTLKSTLDDQIRRSHSLIQTLQSSSTMMDSLVRRQVRDVVEQQFEARLRECTERISRLEYRVPSKDRPISPSVSPSPTNNKEQDMLTQLMSRIDQLESKLVAQKEK